MYYLLMFVHARSVRVALHQILEKQKHHGIKELGQLGNAFAAVVGMVTGPKDSELYSVASGGPSRSY